jgi:hypothetical protein
VNSAQTCTDAVFRTTEVADLGALPTNSSPLSTSVSAADPDAIQTFHQVNDHSIGCENMRRIAEGNNSGFESACPPPGDEDLVSDQVEQAFACQYCDKTYTNARSLRVGYSSK